MPTRMSSGAAVSSPWPSVSWASGSRSWEQAATLCQERDERLCTELEWERACKGPDNRKYEYGDRYRESICETGKLAQLRPSGLRVPCQSDFGVHDMHGSAWEWTDSPWQRGHDDGRVTLRGGNDRAGELVARCANGRPENPETRSGVIAPRLREDGLVTFIDRIKDCIRRRGENISSFEVEAAFMRHPVVIEAAAHSVAQAAASQVAEEIGISQAQVSRLEKSALKQMRKYV